MKYLSRWLCALVALVALCCASCSSDVSNGKVEYIPFQESKDGLWGMISLDGKVLFSEEFKNEPTIVRDGRFFVKNNEGMWEMYTADAKPKKVGGEYVSATAFSHGRALVTMPNKPVCIINTDGEVVKELDRIAGQKVARVEALERRDFDFSQQLGFKMQNTLFYDGFAVFRTTEGACGVINEDGDCILEPKYDDDMFYKDGLFVAWYEHDSDKKLFFFDKKGKETYKVNKDKYADGCPGDGCLAVATMKDDEKLWSILNEKGETICKLPKKIKKVKDIKGERVIFSDGDACGLMDFKGEVLVRAKYLSLVFDGERLIATQGENQKVEVSLLDLEGNDIGKETYLAMYGSSLLDGKHSLVRVDDKSYGIIDEKGELLEKLPDMVNVSVNMGDDQLESDYVDIDNLIKELGIKASGVDGFTNQSSAQSVVERLAVGGYLSVEGERGVNDPYWYDVKDKLSYSKDVENVSVFITLQFPDKLSHAIRGMQTQYDEYWGTTYEEEVTTGYAWNNVKPNVFAVSISDGGKLHGKLRMVFNKVADHFATIGTLAKGNDGAKVYKLKNGMRAFLALERNRVLICWGDIASVDELDIEIYKDAEVSSDTYAPDYYSSEDDDVPDYDSAAVDSAAY